MPPLTKSAKAAWTDFLQDFVTRYGPNGAFWSEHPTIPYVPVTKVQIWNEPSSQTYWRPRPKPKKYGALVKLSNAAIDAVDPTVQTVLAGLFPSPELKNTDYTTYLSTLFKVKGIGKAFDIAAFHPYAKSVGLLKKQIKTMRKLMRKGHVGGKPLWITELGWGSAPPIDNRPLIKGPEGQKQLLEQSFPLLEQNASNWNLAWVVWYSFRDPATASRAAPSASRPACSTWTATRSRPGSATCSSPAARPTRARGYESFPPDCSARGWSMSHQPSSMSHACRGRLCGSAPRPRSSLLAVFCLLGAAAARHSRAGRCSSWTDHGSCS